MTTLLSTLIASYALAQDLELRRIETEFLVTSHLATLEQLAPPEQAALVRRLGDRDGKARRRAFDELAGMGLGAAQALACGILDADPEIAQSCRKLYGRFYRCAHCAGAGRCPACARPDIVECLEHCNSWNECRICRGTGDLRFRIETDYGDRMVAAYAVDLFDRKHLYPELLDWSY